jgi:cytochrome c oxidase subunit 2
MGMTASAPALWLEPSTAQLPSHTRDRRQPQLRRPLAQVAGAALLTIGLAGCGGRQSVVEPASHQSYVIDVLWWAMLAAAAIVFFGALGLLGIGYLKRGRPGMPIVGNREGVAEGMVLVFGIAIPVVVLVTLFGVSNIWLIRTTAPPRKGTTAMTIDVIGHQWWWEVRYPGTGVVTANEIHIPIHTRVNVVATTDDVIHSFWVPELNRKIDTIPGYHNHILLDGDRLGEFRGQCSQYCGFQHANMAFEVFVQRPAVYRAWLAGQQRSAPAPASTGQQAGYRVFMSDQCASCHTIAGTPARGTIGPNLTHIASRVGIASEEIPDNRRELIAWIRNPQAIKPGARMPDLGLSRTELNEVVNYLETLR